MFRYYISHGTMTLISPNFLWSLNIFGKMKQSFEKCTCTTVTGYDVTDKRDETDAERMG